MQVQRLLKSASLLSSGQVAVYGLSFVRNLILARVLTKADFGLAAALSVTISLLEFVSRMSFGKQIIRAPEGDQTRYQAVAHVVQFGIGLGSAVIVLAGSSPLAHAFGTPQLAWAFACLAFVPLARGLMHLDQARHQREFKFRASILIEVLPQLVITLTAWPLALYFKDYRAVLVILILKEAFGLTLSHLLAERTYRWAWDGSIARSMWSFGWPLILNGAILFAAQQSDQLIIGSYFSLEELAPYAIAFTLTSAPWFIFGAVASSLMLPILAKHQGDSAGFALYYSRCLQISTVGSLIALGPMIVAGDSLVRALYGEKYAETGVLMSVFGAMGAIRFYRWAPALAAMARADTLNQLFGNSARALSLPLALLVIGIGLREVWIIAMCGVVGEILALIVTLQRVRTKLEVTWSSHVPSLIYLTGWICIAAYMCMSLSASVVGSALAVVTLYIGGLGVAYFIFTDFRHVMVRALKQWKTSARLAPVQD